MRRKLRNAKGRAKGYGGCYHCGDTWDWKDSHETLIEGDTAFGGISACFPLCEECWQKLGTPEARWPFYEKLIDDWGAGYGERGNLYHRLLTGAGPYDEKRRQIREAVFAGR